MKGYTFVYGVDGFGADVAPAYEEGCYLDFEKAFNHLKELNKHQLENSEQVFYEEGYGEDYYPKKDKEMRKAEENEDWELMDQLLNKHVLTDINAICQRIIEMDEPPYDMYSLVEIEIKA